jgi:hypothetical protein
MGMIFSLLMPQHHGKCHTLGIMSTLKSADVNEQQRTRERMCDTILLNEVISWPRDREKKTVPSARIPLSSQSVSFPERAN